jgi:L-lactate dehydrogenase complex protein LldE
VVGVTVPVLNHLLFCQADTPFRRMGALSRSTPASKDILFMSTCLCDAFFDDAAQASVEVLEYLGCTIEVPESQTCCAQPAFNSGDWASARKVYRHTMKVFKDERPVVLPSGSCGAMIRHGAGLAFEKEGDLDAVDELASRTWEFADYIVNGLGITSWPGSYQARVAFHRSCHTRGTNCAEAARLLLGSIDGLDLVEVGEGEQCCGFGGTFSVSFPNISKSMGTLKLEHLTEHQPDLIASLDMACMMHLGGLMMRQPEQKPRVHVAQILRDALRNGGLI